MLLRRLAGLVRLGLRWFCMLRRNRRSGPCSGLRGRRLSGLRRDGRGRTCARVVRLFWLSLLLAPRGASAPVRARRRRRGRSRGGLPSQRRRTAGRRAASAGTPSSTRARLAGNRRTGHRHRDASQGPLSPNRRAVRDEHLGKPRKRRRRHCRLRAGRSCRLDERRHASLLRTRESQLPNGGALVNRKSVHPQLRGRNRPGGDRADVATPEEDAPHTPSIAAGPDTEPPIAFPG